MKRILSLLLALALCLPLCACGKTEATKAAENAIASIGEVSLDSFDAITQAQKLYDLLTDDEKSKVKNREVLVDALDAYSNAVYTQNIEELKGVYAALKDAYTIVDHYGADIYTAWQKGIYQKDKFQGANLNSATQYLASQLCLDYDEVLDGECYAWTVLLFGQEWEEKSEEEMQKDRDTMATGSLFYMCNDKKVACIITVIGAYRMDGDVDRVNEALGKYDALDSSLRKSESLSKEMETMDKLYTTLKSFFNFCQNPKGSFNEAGDTISQYRNQIQECVSSLDNLLK